MFYFLLILLCAHQHLLFSTSSASSVLFTLDHVRYSLSDRVLTIPKLGSLRGIHIDYEHHSYEKSNLVNVEAFLGIQYGLYHGRFEPSKERFELHPTSKVNKQIQFGPACAQQLWTNQSELARIRTAHFARDYYPKLLKYVQHQSEEQCLYMNIYQPQIKDLKGKLRVCGRFASRERCGSLRLMHVTSEISSAATGDEPRHCRCSPALDADRCLSDDATRIDIIDVR